MANDINGPLRNVLPGNIDQWNRVYATVEEANDAIPSTVVGSRNFREGKVVQIGTVTDHVEYRWKGGFTDAHLKKVEVDPSIVDEIEDIVISTNIQTQTLGFSDFGGSTTLSFPNVTYVNTQKVATIAGKAKTLRIKLTDVGQFQLVHLRDNGTNYEDIAKYTLTSNSANTIQDIDLSVLNITQNVGDTFGILTGLSAARLKYQANANAGYASINVDGNGRYIIGRNTILNLGVIARALSFDVILEKVQQTNIREDLTSVEAEQENIKGELLTFPDTYAGKQSVENVNNLLELEAFTQNQVIANTVPEDAKYVQTSGVLGSSSSFASIEKVPVIGGKKYRYNGAMQGTLQAMVWFDANGVKIAHYVAGSEYTTELPQYTFEITFPSNATSVSYGTYKPRSATASLTYIDESFVNSETLNQLEAKIDTVVSDPRFAIPSVLYAVVGYEQTLFYDNIALVIDRGQFGFGGIQITSDCSIGKGYNSFYKVTATTAGDYALTFRAYTFDKKLIASKQVILRVVSVATFATLKNYVLLGDSLTEPGRTAKRVKDKLTTIGGVAPKPLGTKSIGTDFVNQGFGGWTYTLFSGPGITFYKFYVTGIGAVGANVQYSHNGSTYQLVEQNLTGGTGYISFTRVSGTADPLASGTLTKVNAITGDATIEFSSRDILPGNPLWNNGVLDIQNYIINVLGMPSGSFFSVVNIQLGINDMGQSPTALKTDTEILAILENAKLIVNAFLAHNVNTKVIIQSTPTCNNTGGGFASENMFRNYILNMWRLRELTLQTFDNGTYNARVFAGSAFAHISRMWGYPTEEVTYFTGKTLTVHNNNVHPTEDGYFQIGDGIFPQIYALLK